MDDSRLRDLRAAYDADASRRDGMEPEQWRRDLVNGLAARVLAGGGRRVVELGCGTGRMAIQLAAAGLEVVAIDLSPENVARAKGKGVDAHVADFASLPFENASFDGMLAFNSLLHVPKAALALVAAESRRVLREGASALVVVWGGVEHEGPLEDDRLSPPRFFSFFTDEGLLALQLPGFRRIETRFLHEHEEPGRHRLHPQAMLLDAVAG